MPLVVGISYITETVCDLILELNNILVNIVLHVNNNNNNSPRLYIVIE